MRVVWMLWLVSQAASARPARTVANPALPPVPPKLSVAVDPGPATGAGVTQVPSVQGSATELDLEALARVKRSFSIQVDTSSVAHVTRANEALVVRHLAADPRWRVSEREGVLVAYERLERGSERSVAEHGYQLARHDAVRVGVRFGGWPSGAAWTSSPYVLRTSPRPGVLEVDSFLLRDDPWKGWSATALSIEGTVASLDIYEAGDGKTRQQTARALGSTLAYLQLVSAHASRVESTGYVPFAMPRDEPMVGVPGVEFMSPERGWLDVRARVNPGASGWTWVRVLDESLRPWQEAVVGQGTRERVGWSSQPEQLFYLQSSVAVPRGGRMPATVEVWFQPDGGSPERLLAQPINVPRR